MAAPYYQLSVEQVALAAALILVNGVISLLLRLDLERRLLLAAGRMTAQLLLVGVVLGWVFALRRWEPVLAVAAAMTLIAGLAATRRSGLGYRGQRLDAIAAVWASAWLVMTVALAVVVPVRPWYEPQYAIPLLGMVLGNALNGIALGLDRIGEELTARRGQVEALLTLGATRWEAARPAVRAAVRTGMVPTLNSMAVAGLVSIPGMMTGQLLAGVDPLAAAKYQAVIYFLIAAATALGTVLAALLAYRRLFNAHHQFRHDLLSKR